MKTYYSISNHPKYFEMHTEFRNQFSSPHFLFLHANALLSFYIQSILVWLYSANNSVPHFLMLDKVGERATHFLRLIYVYTLAREEENLFFCLLHGISRGKSSEKYVLVVSGFIFIVFFLVAILFSISYIFHAENFFALYVECIQIGRKVVRFRESGKQKLIKKW